MAVLQVGQKAPDFRLPGVYRQDEISLGLSDFLGKRNIIVWFYVFDWTPL